MTVRANLKFGMERVESDAEVGDTAPSPRLPRPLLTQELAPHGSRDQSRVSSVHFTEYADNVQYLLIFTPKEFYILSFVPICMCIQYNINL